MNGLRPKPSGSYLFLVILLSICVLGPLTGFIDAFVAHKIWGWYLKAYGPGPTLWQWFGIMTLLGLPLVDILIKLQRSDDDDNQELASRIIKSSSMKASIALLTLLSAWVVYAFAN